MRNVNKLLVMLVAVVALWSCATPRDISYFQDAKGGDAFAVQYDMDIRVRNNDRLMIVVHSRDPQLAAMFNLPIQSVRVGSGSSVQSNSYATMSYTVDNQGCIDFPGVGVLQVAGKNREEVVSMVKNEITNRNLLKDPVVTVEFDNMYINVLGEVARPGRYALTKDRVSVIDALGMAGDLAIQGQRKNVKVLRMEYGARKVYELDFTRLGDVVQSPAYYLQQDDVVVVEPNDYKKRQTTENANTMRSTSFYVSIASLLMTVVTFIVGLTK